MTALNNGGASLLFPTATRDGDFRQRHAHHVRQVLRTTLRWHNRRVYRTLLFALIFFIVDLLLSAVLVFDPAYYA